jgi:hypothetical protein
MIKNNLLIVFIFCFVFNAKSQNNYQVEPIPFQQYTGSLPVQFTSDDTYSPLITLPFTFDFYGVNYTSINVSTNGYIYFGNAVANSFSPWNFTQTIPNTSFPVKNSILGAFHDMDNSNAQGTVTYGTYGSAPNRKFIVYFNNNSLFSSACNSSHSSFQMIIYEASSIIDVQLIDKQTCPTWNGGNSVTGLINTTGALAITPPNRNTSSWTAFHEGWRFSRPNYYTNYSFVKCDDNNDGYVNFDLTVAQNDLSPSNPSGMMFFESELDAMNFVNPLPLNYFNSIAFSQNIYARVSGTANIKSINLSVIDCNVDYDNDTVSTDLEDVNSDTNLANDDTDHDGLPNYLDNDDDGDLVLTNLEYVFGRNVTSLLDTDNDGIPNYLDNDDDGDGILTFMEDANGDGNPANDDVNTNGTPDYLENNALSINQGVSKSSITLFPNPTTSILNIENSSNEIINSVSIYSINGKLIKEIDSFTTAINVSDLQSGIYFIKIEMNKNVFNYKFVKK